MLAFGLMHGRMVSRAIARRSLRVTDRGIVVPGRLFTRLAADYADVARIDVGEHQAVVALRNGRTKRIDLERPAVPARRPRRARRGTRALAARSPPRGGSWGPCLS